MRIQLVFALALMFSLSACASNGVNPFETQKKWVGVIAVQESAEVNLIIRESGNDPAIYGQILKQRLGTPGVQPAPGNYCLVPYDDGEPTDEPECFYTTTGVYTMWAPAHMIAPDKSMCALVPDSWPARTGQLQYPERGGRRVNCDDFGAEAANPHFASSKYYAQLIVLVQPNG